MSETMETTAARRRLKKVGQIRTFFAYVAGAALGLAVLGFVRIFSGQDEVFPSVLVSVLVLASVIGERIFQRRYNEALDDVELAARNVVRSEG